jgi:hypothetical protein
MPERETFGEIGENFEKDDEAPLGVEEANLLKEGRWNTTEAFARD